ncbi:MAG: hypothetical protein ACC628_12340 [Pirellulaceae bacterium]
MPVPSMPMSFHTSLRVRQLAPGVLTALILSLTALPGVCVRAQSTARERSALEENQILQRDTLKRATPIQKGEPELAVYSDYFEAHKAAYSQGKHLLVYRCDFESPSPVAIEFETNTLENRGIQCKLAQQFLLVKLAAGDPIQVRTTVQRSGYARRRFGRVRTTWTEVVRTDLFDENTNGPGLLIVRVTGSNYQSGSESLVFLSFGQSRLSPHLFKCEREWTPWEGETFRKIISTRISSAEEYVPDLSLALGLESSHLLEASTDGVADLKGISFDHAYSMDHMRHDRITTRICLSGNRQLASLEDPIDARIDVFSLKNSRCPVQITYRQLQPTEDWQEVEVDDLEPETVYRLRVYFYSSSPTHSLLGEVSLPFDAATGGTTRLANARATIAIRALGEVHDWDRGRTRGKSYVVGLWCERFYWWNFAKRFRTPYPRGYDVRTFSRHNAIVSGRAYRAMARNGNIIGDHVRVSGHGFMVLSYDEHLEQAWTIEGNFGNRVVLTRRHVRNDWSVGTLVESMLKEEAASPAPAESVAAADETRPQSVPPPTESDGDSARNDQG